MEVKGTLEKLLMFILSLVIFIIFAIIYFVVLLFVIDVAAGAIFDGISGDWAMLSAAVITAATLIGGGSLKFFE